MFIHLLFIFLYILLERGHIYINSKKHYLDKEYEYNLTVFGSIRKINLFYELEENLSIETIDKTI